MSAITESDYPVAAAAAAAEANIPSTPFWIACFAFAFANGSHCTSVLNSIAVQLFLFVDPSKPLRIQ